MPISEDQVRHLAKLALLELSDPEVAKLRSDLEAIVGYVEQLAHVDTTGIEPIANVAGLVNVVRADELAAMLPTKAALSIAPSANDNAYLVPKVVER